MAKLNYWPELGGDKPNAPIETTLGYFSKWTVYTDLELKGQGIQFWKVDSTGKNTYILTQSAFNKISKKYDVAIKTYLD